MLCGITNLKTVLSKMLNVQLFLNILFIIVV